MSNQALRTRNTLSSVADFLVLICSVSETLELHKAVNYFLHLLVREEVDPSISDIRKTKQDAWELA